IVLGQQWLEAVPLVRIVTIALLFSFSFELNYPVMVAMGAIRDLFIRSLIVFPVSGLMMAAAIYWGGLQTAAWCLLATVPFQAFVALGFVTRRLGLGYRDIGAAVWKSGVVALASAGAPLSAMACLGTGFLLSPLQAVGAALLA